MAAYIFGTGLLSLTPAGTAQTPVNVGVLKDVSIDISFANKELRGAYQFPLDIANADGKISGKAKSAVLAADLVHSVLSGSTVAPGSKIGVQGETATIPATSAYTATVAHSADWDSDFGVWSVTNGLWLSRVVSAPATNQYSVASGVYTFAAADGGDSVKIYYRYNSAAIGKSVLYTNQLMGTGVPFALSLFNDYRSNSQGVKLYSVMPTKMTFAFKSGDFFESDFDFAASADASGNVLDVFTIS